MSDDAPELDSVGFKNPDNAIRLKKIIRQFAGEQLHEVTGNPQLGRCISVNLVKLKADVWFPGDPEAVSVNLLPNLIPGDVGDNRIIPEFDATSTVGPGAIVTVENLNGKQYITRVVSGGQFAYQLGAAGLGHKVFNASHIIPGLFDHTPQVSGTYGNSFSFFVATQESEVIVGPFISLGGRSMLTGTLRITLSRYSSVEVFEVDINDIALDDPNDFTAESWMRALPKKRNGRNRNLNTGLDFSWRDTDYHGRGGPELWMGLSELGGDQLDFMYIHVESFGPIVEFGDPKSGRIFILDQTTNLDAFNYFYVDGYIGFHRSQHGMRGGPEEVAATDAPYDNVNVSWSTGAYDSAPQRLAKDLLPLWGCTGDFTWSGTNLKFSGNIVFTGVGPSYHGLTYGRHNVAMPATATKIPIKPFDWNGTVASVTVSTTADGFPLKPGDTLYYGIPPGMGRGETDGRTDWHKTKWLFFIVDSETYSVDYVTFTPSGGNYNYNLPQWAIPIARRGIAGERNQIFVTAPNTDVIDLSQYRSDAYTASSASLVAATETIVFTLPSMTYRNGVAYRFRIKTGYQVSTAAGVMHLRFRKGTSGTPASLPDWGEILRLPTSPAASAITGFYHEHIIVNVSGADITTVVTVAANCTVTGNMYANGNTKRWVDVEPIGPAAKYSNVGFAIS